MRKRIVRVAELVNEVGTPFLRKTLADILVVLRVPFADIRARQHDFGTHCAEIEYLLLTHLVGENQDQLVTLLRGNQGEAETRIARSCLEQRVPGFDITPFLGFLDHRNADTVLDGATWICEFELQEQLARAGIHVLQL